MTFTKLIGFGILLAVVMSAVKVFFYQSFNWDDSTVVHYVFWLIAASFSVALIRRLGVITFLEAIVVCSLWIFFQLIVDLAVTASITGYRIFISPAFLIGYLIVIVAMFVFHKKRHVHIRKEMRAKGGGHH